MLARRAIPLLQQLIESHDVHADVILVAGARQVGKTTVVEEVLRRSSVPSIKLNLETDPSLNGRIDHTNSFEGFVDLLRDSYGLKPNQRQILFIDEAQENEVLGSYVRSLKERLPLTTSILSGSSMTRLFREKQRIPVGRFTTLIIHPLSFQEFLEASGREVLIEKMKGIEEGDIHPSSFDRNIHDAFLEVFDQWLTVGGLPRVVTAYLAGKEYTKIRQDIVFAQEDDFSRKSGIRTKTLFLQGLRGVANFIGSPAKYTHISDNHPEAKLLVQLLREWHLIHEIEQKGMNSTSSFQPKRYLYDLGVAQMVRNMPFPSLSLLQTLNVALRTQLGGLIENGVLLNLLASSPHAESLAGWKKGSNEAVEVDFVYRQGSVVVPIECKAALKVTPRTFSGIRRYLREAGLKLGLSLTAAPWRVFTEEGKKLVNIPLYLGSSAFIQSLWDRQNTKEFVTIQPVD